MPRFEPFPGLRYDTATVDLGAVTAPPYDVIDADGRAALASRDPHNVVRIDLPVTDDGDDPYAAAAVVLADWESAGVLRRDGASFYVYRMEHVDEHGVACRTTGVFGALELSRPGEGGILPHEQTTPKAKTDRLDLTRATRANLSAVWGLSPAAGLSALLELDAEPDASWSDDAGVRHTLWVVDDPTRIAAISAAVDDAPVVIADGHHRYEIALAYRDERTSSDGDPGVAGAVLAFVCELAEQELTVLPIHRLLDGLPEGFDVRDALGSHFIVTPAGPVDPGITATMERQGCLVLVEPDRVSLLSPKPGAFAGLRDLDTVRLDAALAGFPAHQLTFQHGVENVVRRVAKGDAQAGVLLRPATVRQIVAIAEGGERMPPKTTFFAPKPATGVVFRTLD